MERLVRQWRETGRIGDRRGGNRGHPFARKCRTAGVRLLAEVDEAFGQMSGLTTCEVLRRALPSRHLDLYDFQDLFKGSLARYAD